MKWWFWTTLAHLLCQLWYQAEQFERRLGLANVISRKLYWWGTLCERYVLMMMMPGKQVFVDETGCFFLD